LEAKAADRNEDRSGCFTSLLAGAYSRLGILGFLLDGRVDSYRTDLSRSAELKLSHFQRFDAGEPIDPSYVTMLAHQNLFEALAAAKFPLATELARVMGGRAKIEKEFDHPFDHAIGYALKAVVLMDNVKPSLETLDRILEKEKYADFRGYSVGLNAIVAEDANALNHGLEMMIAGHARQGKRGMFEDSIEADLCVRGIGLANLARSRGLAVEVDHTLLPRVLVI
jgi:hypothetical protein